MLTADDIDKALASQTPRTFDVYALGPFMIWYALKSKGVGSWPRRALFIAGIYTTVYNYRKYKEAQAFLAAKASELLSRGSV